MTTNNLLGNYSYITPLKYVSGIIREYDIASANVNVLYDAGAISESDYNYISRLPKQSREVEVGLRIRDNLIDQEILAQGIAKAKIQLGIANGIKDNEIVRIANDAVYVNRFDKLKNTQFGNIRFVEKSFFRVMVKLNNLIIFQRTDYDGVNIDVKGISSPALLLHLEYMLDLISQTIYLCEHVSPNYALQYLTDFYQQYLEKKLDIGYYREFNSDSLYKIKDSDFKISNATDINTIDINYNLFILRELYSIILEKANLNRK